MGEESRRMGEQSTFSIFLSLLGYSVLHLLFSSRRGQSCQVNSFFVCFHSQGNIAQLDEVLECD